MTNAYKWNRIKKLLAAAHLSKAEHRATPAPQWQAGVMRSIRQIGPYSHNKRRSGDFIQISWRLAPIALLLMVILSIYIVQTHSAINSQMAAISVSEPTATYLAYMPF